MELVFYKVAACSFGLLHFLKQWGLCSFVHLQQAFRKQKHLGLSPVLTKLQAAEFNANTSKIKLKLFQTNNYKILGINCLPQKQSFTNALQNGLKCLQLYEKEAPTQVFSCEICEILKPPVLQNTSGGCLCRQN